MCCFGCCKAQSYETALILDILIKLQQPLFFLFPNPYNIVLNSYNLHYILGVALRRNFISSLIGVLGFLLILSICPKPVCMPTILRKLGFRFFFYSARETSLVHIEKAEGRGKYIDPPEKCYMKNFTRHDEIVNEEQETFKKKWPVEATDIRATHVRIEEFYVLLEDGRDIGVPYNCAWLKPLPKSATTGASSAVATFTGKI
jgi:hypothetical protein